jgi:polygalacturonase
MGSNLENSMFNVKQYCAIKGGGLVFIPTGTYKCGTIQLKDNITLEISAGAILKYSDEDDFMEAEQFAYNPDSDIETAYFHFALIMCENVKNIMIQGHGTIDGAPFGRGGPKPIAVKSCSNVIIKDIIIRNSPNYNVSFINCENVTIESISIFDGLADGIDLDNCRFTRVTSCYVDAFDDAICLKTSPALGYISSTTDITVTNCTLLTNCFHLKLGTETSGDCRNVTFSNCTLMARHKRGAALGGISFQSADGSHVSNINVNNISMHGVRCPIFLRLGNRGRAQKVPTPGSMDNVIISDITASDASMPIIIAGIPGFRITHLNLSNIVMEWATSHHDNHKPVILNVPELISGYPNSVMFGTLPTWAIYARHIQDCILKNIQCTQIGSFDHRPAVILDDVHYAICEFQLRWAPLMTPTTVLPQNQNLFSVWLNQSTYITIKESIIIGEPPIFHISGSDTKNVRILEPLNLEKKQKFVNIEQGIDSKEIQL